MTSCLRFVVCIEVMPVVEGTTELATSICIREYSKDEIPGFAEQKGIQLTPEWLVFQGVEFWEVHLQRKPGTALNTLCLKSTCFPKGI